MKNFATDDKDPSTPVEAQPTYIEIPNILEDQEVAKMIGDAGIQAFKGKEGYVDGNSLTLGFLRTREMSALKAFKEKTLAAIYAKINAQYKIPPLIKTTVSDRASELEGFLKRKKTTTEPQKTLMDERRATRSGTRSGGDAVAGAADDDDDVDQPDN
jgi:hypothetical protein